MKIYNTEFEWNNKYSCDAFIEITILPSIELNMVVGINLFDKIITTAKCIQKIETKLYKLTDLVCLVNSGYNKETLVEFFKKMHPNITDWTNQTIYIYTFTRKYSIDDKMKFSDAERRFYSA